MAVTLMAAGGVGPRFYGDPPDEHHPWAVHDANRPEPPRIKPGEFSTEEHPGRPPSDAVILFNGKDLSNWETTKGEPAGWKVENGYMEVVPDTGSIRTKEQFGDCQLHIEWAAPAVVKGNGQGRGNSGVFLMGRLEIQVLDSYENHTYADGHAGAYYGINPPMVLPLRPPGHWQVYDIVFRRPVYRDGRPVDPGYVTVFFNGVLVQDHVPLEGPGGHRTRTKPGPFPEKGPLMLQDHGNPVRFRNIWYRPLPPRPSQGGTDGWLSEEATRAKRAAIAASIRADAAKLRDPANPLPEMQRWFESLIYERNEAAWRRADELAGAYVRLLRSLPKEQLNRRRGEVQGVVGMFDYLVEHRIVPADYAPRTQLKRIIQEQGWNRRRR